MSWVEKTAWYDIWARDPEIGGRLANYLDQREVRVYIKDTLMKGYERMRLSDPAIALRVLGLSEGVETLRIYERPHGRLLNNGAVITWGNASDWKTILMAAFERAYLAKGSYPYGVVLRSAVGRFSEEEVRHMIRQAASRLGIERVIWLG